MSEQEAFFSELDEQQAANKKEHQGSCWVLASYFLFIYLAFVFFLWNVGRVTHQTNRELADLYQANNLTEIRDRLAERFAPFSWWHVPSAAEIKGNLTQDLSNTVQSHVNNATDQIKQQTEDVTNQASDLLQQQATDAATQAATDQVNQMDNQINSQ